MPALNLNNLTRHFPTKKGGLTDFTAVDSLNFSVESGEVFGFLGPNGAGKTTTVRMLTALIAPSSGMAEVNGHPLGRDNMAIRRSVGLLTESPGLYENLSARKNLRVFAQLYQIEDPAPRVEKYLSQFGLLERADEATGAFSKGMKQKLALARALLHEPPILFLDEPTSGLDPSASKMVREAIETLSGQGRTIFLCTHNLNEAERLCNRIGVINGGKLIALGTPQSLRQELFEQITLIKVENPTVDMQTQIAQLSFVERVDLRDHTFEIILHDGPRHIPDLVSAMVGLGARIQSVAEKEHSLEDVYLSLVRP